MLHRIGMVLSGGGTRGIAHIGVLQALGEHGIRPDCIAGTSAGALVGALYGAGHSPENMIDFFKRTHPFRPSMFTLRKPGFFDVDRYPKVFREYFPDDTFESLDIRLFVTATDMGRARLEIFTAGQLIPALLASSAVPMVFTPMRFHGRSYSDGGILNNFPIEPLKILCDGIIGVYASPLRNAEKTDLKSALAVSQRAFEVAMYLSSKGKFRECDMLLSPPKLASFGPFDSKRMQEIYEIGYKATIEKIDAIKDRLHEKECL